MAVTLVEERHHTHLPKYLLSRAAANRNRDVHVTLVYQMNGFSGPRSKRRVVGIDDPVRTDTKQRCVGHETFF